MAIEDIPEMQVRIKEGRRVRQIRDFDPESDPTFSGKFIVVASP